MPRGCCRAPSSPSPLADSTQKAPKRPPGCPQRGSSHRQGCRQVPLEPASTSPSLQSDATPPMSLVSPRPTSPPGFCPPHITPQSISVPLRAIRGARGRGAGRWVLERVSPGCLRGVPNTSERADFEVTAQGSCRAKGWVPPRENHSLSGCLAIQPMPGTF